MTLTDARGTVRRGCAWLLMLAVAMASVPTFAQHAAHGTQSATEGIRTPTIAVAADGRLWRAWVDGGHVMVSVSADGGRTFAPSVLVTRDAERLDANGESRPKIALGRSGEVYVSYTTLGARPYTGDVRFARSVDGGRTFDTPRTVNDDGIATGHRFDTLAVGPDGTVYLVWIDKRDLERATLGGRDYDGAALYYTVSHDRGATFAPNRKIKDHVCECCRIAHAFDASGRLVIAWRDILPGSIRDHATARISPDGSVSAIMRLTFDDWKLEGCPHHGSAIAVSPDGALHVAWFTGEGPQGPGLFYARVGGAGRSTPRRLGADDGTAGHPTVAVDGRRVVVAWKERRGSASAVVAMESVDEGRTFGTPREVATGVSAADHPALVRTAEGVVLSWYSPDAGHRILPVGW